jgi:cob(I)alamin adenosyltransferase
MVKLTRIYTRGGDKGVTSLATGKRVPKHASRIEAIGAIDEANATIGLARLHLASADRAMLERIQNDLFDLGADIATPAGGRGKRQALRIIAAQTQRIEREIDAMNAELAPLNSFVLPGGSPAASYLHLARTVVRRAERRLTALAVRAAVNPEALRYVNRLSDHLFVLARRSNANGRSDVLWIPGANR